MFSSKSRWCFFPSCLSLIAVALLNIQMAVISGLPLVCSMQGVLVCKGTGGCPKGSKGWEPFKIFPQILVYWNTFFGGRKRKSL